MSISGSTEISSATSDTGKPIACRTQGHNRYQGRDPQRVQRVDADRRRDHHRQHCRIETGATVLADGRAERGGETGDGVRDAQAACLAPLRVLPIA
jgi:hypothetical protein